jgi:hypothetical protein
VVGKAVTVGESVIVGKAKIPSFEEGILGPYWGFNQGRSYEVLAGLKIIG